MATFYLPSSDGYSTTNQYIKYRIKVVEGTLSNRTRPITVSVQFYRTNSEGPTQRGGTVYCKIAGKEYTQDFADVSSNSISLNSYTELFSKTVNIDYTGDGTASVAISAKWQTNDANSTNYSSDYQGGTVTLTAIAKATYTVTFDANGGIGGPGALTKTHGVDLTIPKNKIPTRTGYTFKEWNTAKDGSGTPKALGGTIVGNQDRIMYAIWTENTLTVNYYSNGADYLKTADDTEQLGNVEKGKNILIGSATHYYDNAYPYGLRDFTYDGASHHMTYTGHKYAKHPKEDGVIDEGWWGTETDGSGINVWQTASFNSGQELAEALGLDLSSESKTVNLYAQWESAEFVFVRENGVWVPATAFVKTPYGWNPLTGAKQL